MENLAQLQNHPELDFWTDIGINRPVFIMLTPSMTKSSSLFRDFPNIQVIANDVQSLINEENFSAIKKSGIMTWDDYYTYDQVFSYSTMHISKNDTLFIFTDCGLDA